jgi:hypothetical protein
VAGSVQGRILFSKGEGALALLGLPILIYIGIGGGLAAPRVLADAKVGKDKPDPLIDRPAHL